MNDINLQNGFVLGKILAAEVTAEQLPEYKNLTYNADNSITLTDLDNVTHTLTPTYDETTGKLISYVFDDKTLFVNYDTDGNLSKVFGIDIEGTENYPQNKKETVYDDLYYIKLNDNAPRVLDAYQNGTEYEVVIPYYMTDLSCNIFRGAGNNYATGFARQIKKMKITKHEGLPITNMTSSFAQRLVDGIIDLDFDTSQVTSFNGMFSLGGAASSPLCFNLIKPIDFSSATSVDGMFGSINYSTTKNWHFTLVPNTLHIAWNTQNMNPDEESLISIANGLNTTDRATLTMHNTVGTRTESIYGTVDTSTMFFTKSDVPAELFEQPTLLAVYVEQNNLVSLVDFISLTDESGNPVYKGWQFVY